MELRSQESVSAGEALTSRSGTRAITWRAGPGYRGMVKFQTDCQEHGQPGQGWKRMCARLGAPDGGLLEGPSLQKLLGTVLAVRPGGQVFLTPSLGPHWGHRIEDRGGRPVVLPDEDPHGLESLRAVLEGAGPDAQLWLDLGGPAAPGNDPEALDAFLALASALPEPPLVVLLRDDAAARVRTHRLAVDRPGQVLLLRETAGGRAYALGRPGLVAELAAAAGWNPDPAPWMPLAPGRAGAPLLVLDVDGVLIDPGRAFVETVAATLAELAPEVAWNDGEFQALKRTGGFNNDFRLTAVVLALVEQGERQGFAAAWGRSAHLEDRVLELEASCTPVVRKQYALFRRLLGPIVTREQLSAFPGELAIFTGRPPQEQVAVPEVLGFCLPMVGDSAPHLRKPRPEGLIQLADAFRADRITFVGDSRDDADALQGARSLRPDLDWSFGAVGPDRALIALASDLQGPSLPDLLAQLGSGDRP